MEKKIEIKYTETFDNIANDLISYLSSYTDELSSIKRVEQFVDRFESRVSTAPSSCQVSPPLLDLGITTFREYNADGLRLLYRVLETEDGILVQADLILIQCQDIQKKLVDYCLLHK